MDQTQTYKDISNRKKEGKLQPNDQNNPLVSVDELFTDKVWYAFPLG